MTVCVTGDVHHAGLATRDQQYLDGTELAAAREYADVARRHDVPVTLFVTGRAAVEDRAAVAALAARDGVEVGGHNHYAFGTPLHKLFRGLTGSWHGPRRFQSWEIGRATAALRDAGADVRSWRDHAYRRDEHTPSLLADRGITRLSDAVGPGERVRYEDGVTVVPVTAPPDHEHVYHAFRTPAFVAESDFDGPFGADSYPVEEWVDRVLDAVAARHAAGHNATVLAHPSCMKLADDFDAFERLVGAIDAEAATTVGAVEPSTQRPSTSSR